MRSQKFTLKNTDDATASRIAADHPADWDMERVFERSYGKFLGAQSQNGTALISETAGDTLEFTEAETSPAKKGLRISRFGGIAAAACIVAEILLIRAICISPDRSETPDNVDIIPAFTRETEGTDGASTAPADAPTDAVTEAISTEKATEPAAEDMTEEITQEITEDNTEESPENDLENDDEAEPEDAPSEESPARETGFTVSKGTYTGSGLTEGFDEIRYTPEHEIPEIINHSCDPEGYMVLSRNEKSGFTEIQLLDTNDGSLYFLTVFAYDSFRTGFDPASGTEPEYLEIGGRPAIYRRDSGDDNAFGYLIWDDGCHVAMLMAEQKNYAEMISIAENFK